MKIALISLNSAEYAPLADLTFYKNKMLYCQKYGYDYINRTDGLTNLKIGYVKIFVIKQILDKMEHDWLYWCGCDTLITNFNKKLEDFCDDKYHFIVAVDCNALNADSFFIRNSPEGRNYINTLLSRMPTYISHPWCEQQAMIDSIDEFQDIINIVPQKLINAYDYSLYPDRPNELDVNGNNGAWSPGDFLIHWPGITLPKRLELARKYLALVEGYGPPASSPLPVPAIGREWPKMLVLHPLQRSDVHTSYIPFSRKIIGWALDPTGPCIVELWYKASLIARTTADGPMEHSSAQEAGGGDFASHCGFEFTADFLPDDLGNDPIDLILRVSSPDGRVRESVVQYRGNLSWEAADIKKIALERERFSVQKLLVALFEDRPVRLLYVFHCDGGPLHTVAQVESANRQIAKISQYFSIADREFHLLAGDGGPALSVAAAGKWTKSLTDLAAGEMDFVLSLDVGEAWSYGDELKAISRTLLNAAGRPTAQQTGDWQKSLLGDGFTFASVNGPVCDPTRVRSVLAIKLDRIGDVVSMIPAIRRIRMLFKGAKLTILVAAYTVDIARVLFPDDEVIAFSPGMDFDMRCWDVAIDFRVDEDARYVVHSVPAHIRVSMCLDSEANAEFAPNHLTVPGLLPAKVREGRRQQQHISEQLCGLVDRLARNFDGFFGGERALRYESGAAPDTLAPLCLLHPGRETDVRYWSTDRYVDLALRLHSEFGYSICIVGTDEEAKNNVLLQERLQDRGVVARVARDLSGDEMVSLVSSASFFVGADSGIKHLACLFGVPGIALHAGRHTPAVWGSTSPYMIDVYSPTTCSPCHIVHRNSCQNSYLCQDNVTLSHVWAAVEIINAAVNWRQSFRHGSSKEKKTAPRSMNK